MKKLTVLLLVFVIPVRLAAQKQWVDPSPIFHAPTQATWKFDKSTGMILKPDADGSMKKSVSSKGYTSFYKRKGEWQHIIDTTWENTMTQEQKLELFDIYTDELTKGFEGFTTLGITKEDWTSEITNLRNQIDTSMSRGAFAALMGRIAFNLYDIHTYVEDSLVIFTPLNPGTPVMVIWVGVADHFGAVLTPLPDSNLLVLRVIDNHPLGIVPGDIVLGYEGQPWKKLAMELFDGGLPFFFDNSGTKSASWHNRMSACGMNWHLFDTIDIVKYQTKDTVHLSVLPLLDLPKLHPSDVFESKGSMLHNEQLPVPGIPFPTTDQFPDRAVNYGIIDGTNIGYIYLLIHVPQSWGKGYTTSEQFLEAINALWETDGLVLDIRLDYGGDDGMDDSYRLLYNSPDNSLLPMLRCSPTTFNLCQLNFLQHYNDILRTPFDPRTVYDRPIAVLTGPMTLSFGDITAYKMSDHPMVKNFGRSTCGSLSHNYFVGDDRFHGWYLRYAVGNVIKKDEPDILLNRREFPVDDPVWFNADDVAIGIDPVVKAAQKWIDSLAYLHDVSLSDHYFAPGSGIKPIRGSIHNPNGHQLDFEAKITNIERTVSETFQMDDTDPVPDSWVSELAVPDQEDFWVISVNVNDSDAGTSRGLTVTERFTTVGPVEINELIQENSSRPHPGANYRFKLSLVNRSLTTEVKDIHAILSSLDEKTTVLTSSKTFPDIKENSADENAGYYIIGIPSDAEPGTDITLKLDIYSENYAYWTDTLTVSVRNVGMEMYSVSTEMYPVPAKEELRIRFSRIPEEHIYIELYDLRGKRIYQHNDLTAGQSEISLDVSSYEKGVYIVKFIHMSEVWSKKLVIE